jgi:hypothetical protein
MEPPCGTGNRLHAHAPAPGVTDQLLHLPIFPSAHRLLPCSNKKSTSLLLGSPDTRQRNITVVDHRTFGTSPSSCDQGSTVVFL